jgi:DNA-binding transcriptional LysR family regulator
LLRDLSVCRRCRVLDLRRLQVLRKVARMQSFSQAAIELSYSQAAVSHHVRRLEGELNVRLLERGNGTAVTLTPAGEVLMRYADDLLATAEAAEAAVASLVRQQRGQIRIVAFGTAASTIAADALVRLRVTRPDLRVAILEAESVEALDALRAHEADVAIVFDDDQNPRCFDGDLEVRPVHDDPFVVALPRDHPLGRRSRASIAQFEHELWIEGADPDTPCSLILRDACATAGFSPKIAFSGGNDTLVQRLVARGVGIALIPSLALASHEPGIVTCGLDPTPARRISVVTGIESLNRHSVECVIAAVQDACALLDLDRLIDDDPHVIATLGEPAITHQETLELAQVTVREEPARAR